MRRPPAPAPPPETAKSRHAPFFVLLVPPLLFLLRFGYDYGISDQDDVLPYVLHRLDASWYARDWFVLGQAADFGIRTYFVVLVQALSLLVPIGLAVLLLYVAAWLLLAGAVYALGYALTRHRPASVAALIVVLVLTPQWTLGGNDLAHTILVPSMPGWALGLWGLVACLRRQPVRAGVLLGGATWLQALVGLHLAGLTGLLWLWAFLRDNDSARPLLVFAGAYVLAALPALGPLLANQLAPPTPDEAAATPSMFYIMALFRNPHHYLPFSFSGRSLVRFGLVAILGIAGFLVLARRRRLYHRAFVTRTAAYVTACCLLALVFTEVVPTLSITQLQGFKTTVLAKVIGVILFCGAVFSWIPAGMTAAVDRALDRTLPGLVIVLGAYALVLGGAFLGVGAFRAKLAPLAHEAAPIARVEDWARTQTPRDAVFAVPPSWSGFRSRARRGIVVNFKSFPYRRGMNAEWFDRLTRLAPVALPRRAGPDLQDRLDAAFMQQTLPDLQRLAARYPFEYVVRNRPFAPASSAVEPVFSAGAWLVYRIEPEDRPAE